MEKLKIGVVGTGHLGKLHAKMFQQISKCELVGIFDSDPDQLAHASKEFNVKAFSRKHGSIAAIYSVLI